MVLIKFGSPPIGINFLGNIFPVANRVLWGLPFGATAVESSPGDALGSFLGLG